MLLIRAAAAVVTLTSATAFGQTGALDLAPVEQDVSLRESNEGAGHGSISFHVGFFDMPDDGDGNPFLDEELTVIEPIVVFDYNATDRLSWGGTFSFDYVSSASIDRLSKFPDQSGASGDTYFGADFNLRYKTSDTWTFGGHAGGSVEYDYTSIGLGLNATQNLRNADASISYSIDAFLDDIDIIRFDGTETEGSDDRTSVSGTVNWYQILSPTAHGEFGVTLAQQDGFLETPYNAVVIEDPTDPPNPNLENNARGTEINEELPDDRFRTAIFGRVRKSTGEGRAWELGGRIYDDDWGISSFTVEPRYYRSLGDSLDMRLRYRYYNQSEADYFQDHFIMADKYRTQDSDLGDFDAHTLGAKFIWYSGPESAFDVSFDYTMRSDNLDYMYALLGWTWGF